MTETGCETCNYIIPGCNNCTSVNRNTGYPLYGQSQFNDNKMYLRCVECSYGKFVKEADSKSPMKCESCLKKYSGCSSCSTNG